MPGPRLLAAHPGLPLYGGRQSAAGVDRGGALRLRAPIASGVQRYTYQHGRHVHGAGHRGRCPRGHPAHEAGAYTHAHRPALHTERGMHVPDARHGREAPAPGAGRRDLRHAVVSAYPRVGPGAGHVSVSKPILTRLSPAKPPHSTASLEQPSAAQLARSGGSLHRFIGLPRWPLLAANRDPTLQEYSSGKPSKDSGCYALIHSGGQLVRPPAHAGGALARARPGSSKAGPHAWRAWCCASPIHAHAHAHAHAPAPPKGHSCALHGGHPRHPAGAVRRSRRRGARRTSRRQAPVPAEPWCLQAARRRHELGKEAAAGVTAAWRAAPCRPCKAVRRAARRGLPR